MVMKKTFWISAFLAMLILMASYNSESSFNVVSDLSNAALHVSGIGMQLGDTSYFVMNMLTQYIMLLSVFYFFLRSIAHGFKN
jgi:hypothetical protein